MPRLTTSPTKAIREISGLLRRQIGHQGLSTDAAATAPPRKADSAALEAPRGRVGKYDQALFEVVTQQPGVTVAEAAARLGVHPTALYPVIRRLQDRHQLNKTGRQLHPVSEDATSAATEQLWCDTGHTWQRSKTRGPKPKRCTAHR